VLPGEGLQPKAAALRAGLLLTGEIRTIADPFATCPRYRRGPALGASVWWRPRQYGLASSGPTRRLYQSEAATPSRQRLSCLGESDPYRCWSGEPRRSPVASCSRAGHHRPLRTAFPYVSGAVATDCSSVPVRRAGQGDLPILDGALAHCATFSTAGLEHRGSVGGARSAGTRQVWRRSPTSSAAGQSGISARPSRPRRLSSPHAGSRFPFSRPRAGCVCRSSTGLHGCCYHSDCGRPHNCRTWRPFVFCGCAIARAATFTSTRMLRIGTPAIS